ALGGRVGEGREGGRLLEVVREVGGLRCHGQRAARGDWIGQRERLALRRDDLRRIERRRLHGRIEEDVGRVLERFPNRRTGGQRRLPVPLPAPLPSAHDDFSIRERPLPP